MWATGVARHCRYLKSLFLFVLSICRPRPAPLFNDRTLMKDTAGLASGAADVPVALAVLGINLTVIGGKLPLNRACTGGTYFFLMR